PWDAKQSAAVGRRRLLRSLPWRQRVCAPCGTRSFWRTNPANVVAEIPTGDLVDPRVVSVVDAADAGLVGRLGEADERPLDAGQRGRRHGEREVSAVDRRLNA